MTLRIRTRGASRVPNKSPKPTVRLCYGVALIPTYHDPDYGDGSSSPRETAEEPLSAQQITLEPHPNVGRLGSILEFFNRFERFRTTATFRMLCGAVRIG